MSKAIPVGWATYQLDEICEVVGGGTPERSNSAYWNGDIPWVSPTEITSLSGRYISNSKEKITEFGLSKSSAKLHPVGTILMTSRASIGFAAINTIPVATNQGFQSFRCTEKIYNEFLYQLITWQRRELERLSAGSTFLEISSTNVKSLSVVIPNYQEQQKIAAILTAVDEAIESTQAQINKLKDLKTSMMQELLTKGIGHTEFKDSPVGRIPAKWDVKLIGEITDIKGGKRLPKGSPFSEKKTPYPYIRISDFSAGSISTKNIKYVRHQDREEIKRYTISKDDVYVSIAGVYLGLFGEVPDILNGALLTENAAKLILNKQYKINKTFFRYMCQSGIVQVQLLQETGVGAGVPKLALFRIAETHIPIPVKNEQDKIATILSQLDSWIENKEIKNKLNEKIKKALMQDLLTGKIRVKIPSH